MDQPPNILIATSSDAQARAERLAESLRFIAARVEQLRREASSCNYLRLWEALVQIGAEARGALGEEQP